MKLLINYANARYKVGQRINSKTGTAVAGFDKVISYSPRDIPRDFYQKNKKILRQPRGNGYWLWKPYFIKKSLELLDEGDVLFYCDSGILFLSSVQPVIDAAFETGQKVVPFEEYREDGSEKRRVKRRRIRIRLGIYIEEYIEKAGTKRDAFILMDCDEPKYTDSKQYLTGYHCWIKSKFATNLADEWLYYAQDERVVTDIPNQLGKPNYPEFREHRHDQSIFSLLVKKYGLKGYLEIVQGDKEKFPQIHTTDIMLVHRQLVNHTDFMLEHGSLITGLWLRLRDAKHRIEVFIKVLLGVGR